MERHEEFMKKANTRLRALLHAQHKISYAADHLHRNAADVMNLEGLYLREVSAWTLLRQAAETILEKHAPHHNFEGTEKQLRTNLSKHTEAVEFYHGRVDGFYSMISDGLCELVDGLANKHSELARDLALLHMQQNAYGSVLVEMSKISKVMCTTLEYLHDIKHARDAVEATVTNGMSLLPYLHDGAAESHKSAKRRELWVATLYGVASRLALCTMPLLHDDHNTELENACRLLETVDDPDAWRLDIE